MDDFAEAALVDAGDVFVDGDDAVEMDEFAFLLVLGNDFDFGVVNDESSGLFFYVAVGDDLVAGGDDFGHVGHVEPAADDLPGAEDPTGAVHDDGFVEAGFAEAFGGGVDDSAGEADGSSGGLVGEGIELAAVFVAFWEVVEELGYGGDSGGEEGLGFFGRYFGKGGELCFPGDHYGDFEGWREEFKDGLVFLDGSWRWVVGISLGFYCFLAAKFAKWKKSFWVSVGGGVLIFGNACGIGTGG